MNAHQSKSKQSKVDTKMVAWRQHKCHVLVRRFLPECTCLLVMASIMISFCRAERGEIHLSMPDVRPIHDESYLCTSHRLDSGDHKFIVGFQPNASASKVHHILIYGCGRPGIFRRDTPNYAWECGEMNNDGSGDPANNPYEMGPVCESGSKSTILFGWALDAPAIKLPPEVGFKIGGNSGLTHLVLQVHYGHTHIFKTNPSITDNSGIILETVTSEDNEINKLAGIYLLVSYGYVPKGVSKHTMECSIDEDKVIHPFRFRTHTHKLGTKVAAYKKPLGAMGQSILIGEHDPQQPQMFYPVEDTGLTLTRGDRVYAYCDYNNTRGKTVYIGATGNDEMCNFYMMYWTDGEELLKAQDCLQYNPH